MKYKRGLSLVEILIASIVLSLALLSLFLINSSSHQMTMDSYFELLAVKIAQEPLEVFKAVGYPGCLRLPHYPIGKTVPITNEHGRYPAEAAMFERTITLDASAAPLYVVTVAVAPLPESKARTWMRKSSACIILKRVLPVFK